MKVSQLIKKLQIIQEEYGDLDVYEYNDWATINKFEGNSFPKVSKIYSQKWEDAEHMKNELSNGNLDEKDEELHDVDLTKPIVKGVIIG